MTQAALAARAGVSRKWLIGLEQGARTGAELGKVLEVLRALNLSIQLIEEPKKAAPKSTADVAVEAPSDETTPNLAKRRKASTLSTGEALKALEAMRHLTAPSRNVLEAMRQASQPSPSTLEAIRKATTSSTTVLEAMRQAAQFSPSTLEAIRQATSSTAALEAISRNQDKEE